MSVNGALIAVNVLVFLLQGTSGDLLVGTYALWPFGTWYSADLGRWVGFAPWQVVTYAFLHGNTLHLFLNMFALWMFGRQCEHALGSRRYLRLYAAAVLTAAGVQLVVASLTAEPYPTVGASGGVFGVLLTFGFLFPRQRVMLLIPPIPMPAWVFVTLYGAIELVSGVLGTAQGIAHFAHLGGMLGAWIVLVRWRDRRGRPPRAPWQ